MAIYQPPYFGQQYGAYPMQSVPQVPQMPNMTQGPQDIIWVQGEAGAKSYMVAPGHTVPLWDSESQTIYLKSADQSGMPSMRIIDYTERLQGSRNVHAAAQTDADYVKRSEIDALIQRVEKLEGGLTNESSVS